MAGRRILSIVGLVATLAAAYGFERLDLYMRERLGRTASMALGKSLYWVESIVPVVLAAMLLLLAWYVVTRANRSLVVGVVFIVVGMFLTFVMATEISLLERTTVLQRVGSPVYMDSYGHYAAAFLTVIGVACLVAPKRLSRRSVRGAHD